MNEIIYTFYFVSGEKINISFSEKKANEIIDSLKNGWNECSMIGNDYGINFYLITHYEKKE